MAYALFRASNSGILVVPAIRSAATGAWALSFISQSRIEL
jgi:hypothetical protein